MEDSIVNSSNERAPAQPSGGAEPLRPPSRLHRFWLWLVVAVVLLLPLPCRDEAIKGMVAGLLGGALLGLALWLLGR